MPEAPSSSPWRRAKTGSARRAARESRRISFRAVSRWRELLRRPETTSLAILALIFIAIVSLSLIAARERLVPPAGRLAPDTRLSRVDFSVEDVAATQKRREFERVNTPRVYVADRAALEAIETSLTRLPASLVEADALDKVAPEIRDAFALNDELLLAIRSRIDAAGEVSANWKGAVRELLDILKQTPLVTPETVQLETISQNDVVELRAWDKPSKRVHESAMVAVGSESFDAAMAHIVRQAGFGRDVQPAVVARLVRSARPTFSYDDTETRRLQDASAAAVKPEMIVFQRGDALVRRGETITETTRDRLSREMRAWHAQGAWWRIWSTRLGLVLLSALLALGLAGYTLLFAPKTFHDPRRLISLAAIVAGSIALSCASALISPALTTLAVAAPAVFLAVAVVIAFGQRFALAFAAAAALVLTLAVSATPSLFFTALAGVVAVVWRLREIRNRRSVVSAGLVTAAAMALASLAGTLVEMPPNALAEAVFRDALADASQAAVAALLVAFVTLGVLPVIERAFDAVTGMTLMELRDTRHPLLRELAQRAPGTYTHSMTVASLAEAAADAVGADSLHLHVGALYHDIGKMNKPQYFVENQARGVSRHDRLSPAMSLLVIVGHVKDGMELAREHNLPRSIQHYIESHHGTTLVEYFYNRAREQAGEAPDANEPEEFGYRYPGPRPRTKEAAILMLCDAIESASRALAEPTPARIESLVGAISGMRLTDGQFDECDITLREIHIIEQSIIKSLNSIYHARIAYPSTAEKTERRPKSGAAS
ncbi:MAG: HD family phosphohydrolase [Phycisphaerales bacterium]